MCWPMFAFLSGSKCGPASAPLVPVRVCVCLLSSLPAWKGARSHLSGVYGPRSWTAGRRTQVESNRSSSAHAVITDRLIILRF